MLDYVVKLDGKRTMVKNKVVENEKPMYAYSGSGFDTWFILNSLTSEWRIVDLIKNEKGIISLDVFDSFLGDKPQSVFFSFRMTH